MQKNFLIKKGETGLLSKGIENVIDVSLPQAHLSSLDTDKSEMSTRFIWPRPVQTNAQCYEFSILRVHLTQTQEMKVLILLDKEQK